MTSELLKSNRRLFAEREVQKEKALQDVRQEVASLALDIAEKVIGERMKDEAMQRKTIEQLIDKL